MSEPGSRRVSRGDPAELRREIASIDWYHTLELAPGVVTPGWLDTRSVADAVPLPSSLTGLRCLDVGTFNGFWAFEMERRGAAEVVAIDVLDPYAWDWPADSAASTIEAVGERHANGVGFDIAKRELSSSVQRLDRSVYDAAKSDIGDFDLVYVGSLLVHLRDPVGALERLRNVCRGQLVLVDGIDPFLTLRNRRTPVAAIHGLGRPWWFYPNLLGLARLVEAAGFELASEPRRLNIPAGPGWSPSKFSLSGLRTREGRYRLFVAWKGDPHGVIVARPKV